MHLIFADLESIKGGDRDFQPEQGWGSLQFLDDIAIQDASYGFLENGWFRVVCEVKVLNTDLSHLPSTSRLKNEEEPKCIFCLEARQTCGVRHGEKYPI